ncbi:MAG: site-2 protease family protein [Burkholderiaceae bacterium]
MGVLRLSGVSAPSAPLLSAQWFRVAALRPRLDPQAHAERVSYRRQTWHVLVRSDGSRSLRLNAAAYAFVGRCDGTLSVQRLWDLLLAERGDGAPTQDELLGLLARLHAAKLLGFERKPDFGPQGTVQAETGADPSRSANSLLSFRIPLGKPDRWLNRVWPSLAWLFTPAALALWSLGVFAGLVAAVLNMGSLVAQAQTWMATPRMLLMVWMAYPVVKALHELAHALALKRWGCKVPEWGITVLMFTPVPYVDAAAASTLASPSQRLLVSAAGIMLELILASLALAVALNVEPGVVRDLAYAVFFIGSVSTLLVNGNPLLRFDGYYALTDMLQLPNLATRSARHWIAWLRRCLLRVPAPTALFPAHGEEPWLWAYAPLALGYRILISGSIVAWLGHLSFLLGVAISLYFIWGLAGKPLLALWGFLQGSLLAEAERSRARRRAAFCGAALLLLVGLLPLPFSSVVQGVVWLPEHARVRAQTEGFVDDIRVVDGQAVDAGQILFTLRAPMLEPERARLTGRVSALETERYQALRSDPSRAVGVEHELDGASAALARVQERQAQLEVRAIGEGIVVINHAADLFGRFVKEGALLAYVLRPEPTTVRVAIPHEQAALVQANTRAVSVRFAENRLETWPGRLLRDVAGTVPKLPSAALGDRGGGSIVTDPGDKLGLTPAHGVVLADVRLGAGIGERSGADPGERFGARAWVRFDHGFAPLAAQGTRRLQQLFLKHFNPSE